MILKFHTVALLALTSLCASGRGDVSSSLPDYKPTQVAAPREARYVLPNGGIQLYGSTSLRPLVRELNALFVRTHPGFKFDTSRMKGPSSGIAALTYDVTAFAAIERPVNNSELASYSKTMGDPPFAIQAAIPSAPENEGPALIFYVRVLPGDPMPPFTREYLRMVLSKQGQAVIASPVYGYQPLTTTAAATELAKLNHSN